MLLSQGHSVPLPGSQQPRSFCGVGMSTTSCLLRSQPLPEALLRKPSFTAALPSHLHFSAMFDLRLSAAACMFLWVMRCLHPSLELWVGTDVLHKQQDLSSFLLMSLWLGQDLLWVPLLMFLGSSLPGNSI